MVVGDGLTSDDIVRSEVNFLVLPFFALWDKDVKRRTKTEYKAVIKRGRQKLEVSWIVLSQPEFGYPGPFDKKVHKAKAFGGEPFTKEEIEEMYLRFKADAPKTLEEKRAWLISHDSEYALSSIISELREELKKNQPEESKETKKGPPG